MRTSRILFLTLALAVAAAPAMAATTCPPSSQIPQPPQVFPSEPQAAPGNQLNEHDMASILAWIKQAMDDAANGKTVEVPPDMRDKLEAMGKALKQHSIDLSNALLNNLREQIRRLQRENPPPRQLPVEPPASIHL